MDTNEHGCRAGFPACRFGRLSSRPFRNTGLESLPYIVSARLFVLIAPKSFASVLIRVQPWLTFPNETLRDACAPGCARNSADKIARPKFFARRQSASTHAGRGGIAIDGQSSGDRPGPRAAHRTVVGTRRR